MFACAMISFGGYRYPPSLGVSCTLQNNGTQMKSEMLGVNEPSSELRFTKILSKGRYLGNCPHVVINQIMVILETAAWR